jgi:TetR/AcrR family transcriptional regulator, transcriptional repressor of aconitase
MPRVSGAYLERRRAEILAAALRCFAREGFHRTTMQDIVREARLSPGAIYRYFAAKEDIIAAIAAERHAAERAMLHEAASRTDVEAGLHELVSAFLGRLADPAEQEWRRVTVQVWGEALRSAPVLAVAREGLDEPLRTLAALIRRSQQAGRLARDLDADALARVAAAIFQGLVLQQAWDPDVDVAAYARAAEVLLAALLRPTPVVGADGSPRRPRRAARPRG